MKKKVKVILLGGFLGSGKTTAIVKAAEILSARGMKVGLISNDQAKNLVDTALFENNYETREVSGSCFCCNFKGFVDALESLAKKGAEVVIAEPVGSCTDLASTIIRPLKKDFKQYQVAPLAVLFDAQKIEEIFVDGKSLIDPDAAYILGCQLKEADVVICSKSDLLDSAKIRKVTNAAKKISGGKDTFACSALSGKNMEKWLDIALSGASSGESKIEVDYDKYAHGEAVLGWLNARVSLVIQEGQKQNLRAYLNAIFSAAKKEFKALKAEVGHMKALATFNGIAYSANIVSLKSKTTIIRREVKDAQGGLLIINARVQMPAKDLECVIKKALQELSKGGFKAKIDEIISLTPGRPNPTYRL